MRMLLLLVVLDCTVSKSKCTLLLQLLFLLPSHFGDQFSCVVVKYTKNNKTTSDSRKPTEFNFEISYSGHGDEFQPVAGGSSNPGEID